MTLIAFIFFPLGALSAFLNLKSRYKDWRGTKSKVAFEKRLEQLEIYIYQIRQYRKSPTAFFVHVLHEVVHLLTSFLFAFSILVVIFFISTLNIDDGFKDGFSLPSFISCGFLLLHMLNVALRLSRLIRHVYHAEILAIEVIEFVKKGKSKGLISKDDNKMIDSLLKNEMFTENELSFLKHFMSKSLNPSV